MSKLPLLTVVAVAISTALAAATAVERPLLKHEGDRIARRAFLPSAERRHGELRLVRRGDATCVQTLLYSSAMRRGLQNMRKRERNFWPEGQAGFVDSTAYLAALEQAARRIEQAFDERTDRNDARQKMLIEFVLAADAAFFAIFEVEIEDDPAGARIVERRPIVVADASRDYVRREMLLMLESGFHESAPSPESYFPDGEDRSDLLDRDLSQPGLVQQRQETLLGEAFEVGRLERAHEPHQRHAEQPPSRKVVVDDHELVARHAQRLEQHLLANLARHVVQREREQRAVEAAVGELELSRVHPL